MKTKNIFKALALAMLVPAMLFSTACQKESTVQEEDIVKKGYELPVTVNVTRQGDDAITRASFDDGTKKLSFSTGDKLFVCGSDVTAGVFAGALTWTSGGTFSGTILTQNKYSGTADELLTAASDTYANLLPNGYDTYGFLSINNEGTYSAYVSSDYHYAFATSKAAAVEQFSYESSYSYSNGFALTPESAILNFTITGLAASTEVAVAFSGECSASGTVTTDGSGTATFAVGVMGDYTDLNGISLTVGGNAITLVNSSKTLAAGKIYNINRSAAPAAATGHALSASAVGEVVGTDGLAYDVADKDNLPTGVTAAGMVAYKSGSNGLVIALADEASTMVWSTANGASGAAAHTPTVTGQAWKLPSQDEWNQMFSANGGSVTSYSGLNTAITNAGGTYLQNSGYWSSTEHSPGVDVYFVDLYDGDAEWYNDSEGNYFRVRACLAFSSAPAYTLLSAVTTADYGKVVCAAGHLHDAKTAVPAGCTAVGILAKVTETGHGLILALQNATDQRWDVINGWESVTAYASTTLKLLPDDTARGSLTSYTTLGSTTVSNWCVAQKDDYDAIFTNLGSEVGDSDGMTYDANVNAFITTGVGGTAITGYSWSATRPINTDNMGWYFGSDYWDFGSEGVSRSLRPVLAF